MTNIIETISVFASQWVGISFPKLFLLFFGILLCIFIVASVWDKRIKTGMQLFPLEKISHGTAITAPAVIVLAVSAVILVGMLAPKVMIGDEVTHFYMMETQSRDLMVPNFQAKIPTGHGEEVRRYPHPFLWHYFGAVLFHISGGSFFVIQIYQAFFLAQLLVAAYLLARSRGGIESRSALVYLLLIVSLPMILLFSVAFYQDVPMTAQVLTAFYLLRKGRWFFATLFLCLGLGLKVTAILFFPAFFIILMVWTCKKKTFQKMLLILACSLIITSGFTFSLSKILKQYADATFYPVMKLEQIIKQVSKYLDSNVHAVEPDTRSGSRQIISKQNKKPEYVVGERIAEIIANHPGDLRLSKNFFIYGGGLLYLCMIAALAGGFYHSPPPSLWLWATGMSSILFTLYFLPNTPDARFFLPGIIFCMLPIAERVVCLPWKRWIIFVIATIAIIQSGYAIAKIYQLRRVSPELNEAIHYLHTHTPQPSTVFMYPEGNYRLFPVQHRWDLKYNLRAFWRADNDSRIRTLHYFGIGAVVIKKYLIAKVDEQITNLGVYPTYFVKDLANDKRFPKLFENSQIVIYGVPEN